MEIIRRICNGIRFIIKGKSQYASIEELRDSGMRIGNDCEIYAKANFGSEPYLITIGDHVRINAGVTFVTHDGGVWVVRYLENQKYSDVDIFGKIVVGNNVHIGTGATIMPGVTIGNNVIIGCGAIVSRDIPNNSVAVGVPAKVIETIDEYLKKNEFKMEHTKNMSYEDKKEHLKKKYGI
ncbi:MAG: acyltransferase [Lachnospiraceae bacterium]|nr:acyltransferase [Lachnospiraceae bacterium]